MTDYERRAQQRDEFRQQAQQMDDEALRTYGVQLWEEDGDLIDRGFRGLIDDPRWAFVTVAQERGLRLV